MREDALITEVRVAAQLPDVSADYTDARIRQELNTLLQGSFARVMVKARVGMLLKRHQITMTAGTSTYPLPGRALAAGFEALDISDGTNFWPVKEIQASDTWAYETTTNDRPRFYVVKGSAIRFFPAPNQAYTARCQYYLRPSTLVQKQATNDIGRVLQVSQSGGIILAGDVTDVLDRINVDPISEFLPIDIIRGSIDGGTVDSAAKYTEDASYEVVAPNLTWEQGLFATILIISGSFDLSEVQAGDYVRAAGQSEWPSIPHEYHPALAWAAASKICRDRGMYKASEALMNDVRTALGDLAEDIQPRVKSEAQTLVPRASLLRRRVGML